MEERGGEEGDGRMVKGKKGGCTVRLVYSRIEEKGRGQAGRVKLCVEEGRSDSCEYYDRLYTE